MQVTHRSDVVLRWIICSSVKLNMVFHWLKGFIFVCFAAFHVVLVKVLLLFFTRTVLFLSVSGYRGILCGSSETASAVLH